MFCQSSLPLHSCSPVPFWDHVLRALKVSLLSQQEHRQATSPYSGAFPWTRKSNLDYLALDFNSASPSPVQKVRVIWKTPQPPLFLSAGRKTRWRQTLLGALSIMMKPVMFPADCICGRFKINTIKALLGWWQGVLRVTHRGAINRSSAEGTRLGWDVQPWGLVGKPVGACRISACSFVFIQPPQTPSC